VESVACRGECKLYLLALRAIVLFHGIAVSSALPAPMTHSFLRRAALICGTAIQVARSTAGASIIKCASIAVFNIIF